MPASSAQVALNVLQRRALGLEVLISRCCPRLVMLACAPTSTFNRSSLPPARRPDFSPQQQQHQVGADFGPHQLQNCPQPRIADRPSAADRSASRQSAIDCSADWQSAVSRIGNPQPPPTPNATPPNPSLGGCGLPRTATTAGCLSPVRPTGRESPLRALYVLPMWTPHRHSPPLPARDHTNLSILAP